MSHSASQSSTSMGSQVGKGMRNSGVSSPVLAMGVFVCTEVMFFTALISSYLVIRAGQSYFFLPPDGVKLPVVTTAFNTAMLLASGLTLYISGKRLKAGQVATAYRYFLWTLGLGGFFVIAQGLEWVSLLRFGLTMTSGLFGATFFLVIGSHGLHAALAIIIMACFAKRFSGGAFNSEHMKATQVFWYFVVGIWPILYGLVYF